MENNICSWKCGSNKGVIQPVQDTNHCKPAVVSSNLTRSDILSMFLYVYMGYKNMYYQTSDFDINSNQFILF